MTTPPPEFPAEQPPASPANLASWGTRAVGLIIDLIPVFVLALLFGGFNDSFFFGNFVGLLGLAYQAYMGYLDGTTGQTPGKAIMGTRVVDIRGELLGAGPGVGRKFLHIVDGLVCGLGWLLPLVDAKRQTIADKLINSYVVEGVERKPFSIDLWLPPKS